MPTVKQKLAFKEVVENGRSVSGAMRDVGYSSNTAVDPSKLTGSIGWKELMDTVLNDNDLVKKHREQLNSSKHHKLYFDIDDSDERIEDVCKQLGVELLYIKENKAGDGKTANVKAPDFFFRDLALDKAYKVKGRYSDPGVSSKTLIINITGETASRYGLLNEVNQRTSPDSPGQAQV